MKKSKKLVCTLLALAMLASSGATPLCSLPRMMAVGFVKSQLRRGLAVGVQSVTRICMPERAACSSSLSRWRLVATHLRAEAEDLRPSRGKAVSV